MGLRAGAEVPVITATAEAAFGLAVAWLSEAIKYQPFGEVSVVSLQHGNIVCIRKSIEETTKP